MACFVSLGTSRRNFVEGAEFSAISISGEVSANAFEIGSPRREARREDRDKERGERRGRKERAEDGNTRGRGTPDPSDMFSLSYE